MFKLIIFYVAISGAPALYISPITTYETCYQTLQMAPAKLAAKGEKILAGACIDIRNIKGADYVQT